MQMVHAKKSNYLKEGDVNKDEMPAKSMRITLVPFLRSWTPTFIRPRRVCKSQSQEHEQNMQNQRPEMVKD